MMNYVFVEEERGGKKKRERERESLERGRSKTLRRGTLSEADGGTIGASSIDQHSSIPVLILLFLSS